MHQLHHLDTVVENYHGTMITDPYRWLEEKASEETRAWVGMQNEKTSAFLRMIPARHKIQEKLTSIWKYPRQSVPERRGNRYFFTQNTGLQNQSVLCIQETGESGPRVLLDPNKLSADGTIALRWTQANRDGSCLAYSLALKGSDWQEIRIRDVESGVDYPEIVRRCRATTLTWHHTKRGFYYNCYPDPETVAVEDQTHFNRVYWHALNTPQAEDVLVFEIPDAKELKFEPRVTSDGDYLVLTITQGTDPNRRVYYREIESSGSFVRLLDDADANYRFLDNDGFLFYFFTTFEAPRGRIIAIDVRSPEKRNWQEIVPQQEDVIDDTFLVNSHFVLIYLHSASHQIKLYRKGFFVREIALPALGTVVDYSGEPEDREMFFSLSSFLLPASIYRYDFSSDTLELFRATSSQLDTTNYETVQAFYPSKDGTLIPMFLTHKKGLLLDGKNPTLLHGYGGFRNSQTPLFTMHARFWIEQGGVYAVANLRGGGEYGEDWHQAGILEKKQNVFDDFIAAAEWLIEQRYTAKEKLAISGGSNGGLLVAACLVQRPELFGAVLCRVPVIDMLRYQKWSVGHYWISEYGNAETNAEQFKFLYAYSPLHTIKEGVSYPPTLITTADTDDRVDPAHARKFAASLQAANSGPHPILLRVEASAGHGVGNPTSKIIELWTDSFAFLFSLFDLNLK